MAAKIKGPEVPASPDASVSPPPPSASPVDAAAALAAKDAEIARLRDDLALLRERFGSFEAHAKELLAATEQERDAALVQCKELAALVPPSSLPESPLDLSGGTYRVKGPGSIILGGHTFGPGALIDLSASDAQDLAANLARP